MNGLNNSEQYLCYYGGYRFFDIKLFCLIIPGENLDCMFKNRKQTISSYLQGSDVIYEDVCKTFSGRNWLRADIFDSIVISHGGPFKQWPRQRIDYVHLRYPTIPIPGVSVGFPCLSTEQQVTIIDQHPLERTADVDTDSAQGYAIFSVF